MQGLNRYIPPDYDPKKNSTLNSHQGKKHALGVRAKDIDKGILVVRFELPFNIWCGTCNAHIGAGVRYNARKQKVGKYYSTPIYGFKCKCHLCDGWFEIRTDPKNAAYEVYEGARKKDEDWNPEENGGFAVHDTEAPSASEPPSDPFAGVEKTIDQQKWASKGTSRLTELTRSSDRINGDPYVISSALRRKFREEKKVALDKQIKDENIKERFGLHDSIDLDADKVDANGDKSREAWLAMRENRNLSTINQSISSGSASRSASIGNNTPMSRGNGIGKGKGKAIEQMNSPSLVHVLMKNTGKKYDPFDSDISFTSSSGGVGTPIKLNTGMGLLDGLRVKGKIKGNIIGNLTPKQKEKEGPSLKLGLGGGLLAGYGSD
ncbi:uncharacterized protein IL334_006612 [Kwoniella shivajii]|uniref:Coiled-coil domain-containing protein 130 n=1 Tax=Kwoniella shivajii TaxID=564305 RepID=A0ABZ1D6F4_9TREE|nr:hypothetical protein IL334_006612 [Kwoniella shivajii]